MSLWQMYDALHVVYLCDGVIKILKGLTGIQLHRCELGLGRIFGSSNICSAMHECQISDTNFYPRTFSTFPNSSGDIMIYGQSTEEEGLIEDILRVLKPLKTATIFISAQKLPTASKILPTLTKLRMEMTVNEATDSPLATEMKICILENLNRRYTDEKLSSFLLKASFLDP